jgi:predicted branched-subunit amino acid permease
MYPVIPTIFEENPLSPNFRSGAREGFMAFLPLSVGLVPWALVMGMAMTSAGFSPLQAMGMNIIVFAGTAQLGTLPLIAADAPVWLIITTALALNLRFVIFSAAIAPGFRGVGAPGRWLAGHVLTDGVFAVCLDKLLHVEDPAWRLGYYLAPALWAWVLWQVFALTGIYAAGFIPKTWSLEFMATIALITLLVPMAKVRPMLIAALVGGASATLLRNMPLRLGVVAGICAGIAAGFAAEHFEQKASKP